MGEICKVQTCFRKPLAILLHETVDFARGWTQFLDIRLRQPVECACRNRGNIGGELPQWSQTISDLQENTADEARAQEGHGRYQPQKRAAGGCNQRELRRSGSDFDEALSNHGLNGSEIELLAVKIGIRAGTRAVAHHFAPFERGGRVGYGLPRERPRDDRYTLAGDLPVPAGAAPVEWRAVQRGVECHAAACTAGERAPQSLYLRVEPLVDLFTHHAGNNEIEYDGGDYHGRGDENHGKNREAARDRRTRNGRKLPHGSAFSM
ncbi:hypothetical protein D3C87_1455890 [compost metagenome]